MGLMGAFVFAELVAAWMGRASYQGNPAVDMIAVFISVAYVIVGIRNVIKTRSKIESASLLIMVCAWIAWFAVGMQ